MLRFIHGGHGTNENLGHGNRTQKKVAHRVATYEMMYNDVGGLGLVLVWNLTPHPMRHGG